MSGEFRELWGSLSATPVLWLTLTLLAYQAGDWLFRRSGANPLCNPVLVAICLLVALLWVSGTDYQSFLGGAQFLGFLLGPATVALAIPLYRQIHAIRRALFPLSVAVLVGSLTAVGSAVVLAWGLGASRPLLMSLAPKSVTSPIAMGISEQIGGLPSLAAVSVILTGIFGAAFGGWILDRLRIRDDMARGIAMGVASHGIGTARAMRMSPLAGAFAGLGMGLNGLATALLLPALVALFGR